MINGFWLEQPVPPLTLRWSKDWYRCRHSGEIRNPGSPRHRKNPPWARLSGFRPAPERRLPGTLVSQGRLRGGVRELAVRQTHAGPPMASLAAAAALESLSRKLHPKAALRQGFLVFILAPVGISLVQGIGDYQCILVHHAASGDEIGHVNRFSFPA